MLQKKFTIELFPNMVNMSHYNLFVPVIILQICNVCEESAGVYECRVLYAVESKKHVAKYTQTLAVQSDDSKNG